MFVNGGLRSVRLHPWAQAVTAPPRDATAPKVGEGIGPAGPPEPGGPAAQPARPWSAYILRGLSRAVDPVLVVTVVTFAIFFLMPRLAGATPDAWSRAVRRQGPPTRQHIHAAAKENSASTSRSTCSTGTCQGHLRRAPLRHRDRRRRTAPRRASGTPSSTDQRGLAASSSTAFR